MLYFCRSIARQKRKVGTVHLAIPLAFLSPTFGGQTITQIVDIILALLIAIDIHELSHALVADYLGDDTPRLSGHISLNPFRHMDQFGILLLVLLAISGMGFAYGFTPVNESKLRRRTRFGPAIVAVAGPLSNLLAAAVLAIPIKYAVDAYVNGGASLAILGNTELYNFTAELFLVNVLLFVFNIIPLPPLDGWTIFSAFLSRKTLYEMRSFVQYGPFILLLVFIFNPYLHILDNTIFPMQTWVVDQLLRL
jgi:Zn-dependent protease